MKPRKYSFDNFAIGKANQLVYLSVRRTLKELGKDINPLFIYSGKGLGKTHLVSSIMETIPKKQVVYLDGAEFETIPSNEGDVLILENIHLLDDETRKGIGLYNFIKSYTGIKKQVYITSLLPPEKLDISEQLFSLIKQGLTVPIFKPETELVGRIFKMLSSDYGVDVSDNVIEYLSGLPFYDVREIETVLKKIDLLKDVNEEITIENVKEGIGIGEIVPAEREEPQSFEKDSEFLDFIKDVREGFGEPETGLKDAGSIREDYMQKLYIWKMKGFNVERLEKAMDGSIENIIEAFISFTADVQRLIDLQKRYGELERETTPDEKKYFEKSLFDPDAFSDIENVLTRVEERKRLKEDYMKFLDGRLSSNNLVILPSNREAYKSLKTSISDEKEIHLPIYLYGAKKCGKTHLLVTFTRKMQLLYPYKVICYIPSKFFIFELKNLFDDAARAKYMERLSKINTIFLDGIEDINSERECIPMFYDFLDSLKKENNGIIVSSTLPPQELDIKDEYKDFLMSGTVIGIKLLNVHDRKIIINNLFAQQDIPLQGEIGEYLSQNFTGNFIDIKEEVRKLVKRVKEENLGFRLDNIMNYVGAKGFQKEGKEKGEKSNRDEKEREKRPIVTGEEIEIAEIDIKWPTLSERIFEEYDTEQ